MLEGKGRTRNAEERSQNVMDLCKELIGEASISVHPWNAQRVSLWTPWSSPEHLFELSQTGLPGMPRNLGPRVPEIAFERQTR